VHGPVPGPGSTDNFRVRVGVGPGPNDSNQTFIGYFRLPRESIRFSQRKRYSLLRLSYARWASETNPTDLIFSRIFVASPSQI
jgi:hypothetical protein